MKMKKRKDGRFRVSKVVDGKQKYFYGDTRSEAYAKLEAFEAEKVRPRTFAEIATAWQNEYWDSFAPGTRTYYRAVLRRAQEKLGDSQADEVTPMDVQRILEEMKRQGYALKTVKAQKVVISTVYKHGILHGLCKTNPATAAKLPRDLPYHKRRPPEERELEAIKKDKSWLFPQVLLYTGCRRGEALALNYEDFDFENNTVNIDKEILLESSDRKVLHRTKTHAGLRKVPFVDALKQQIPRGKKGMVFADDITGFQKKWAAYCERLNISVTPHQLRHAYATMLYDAGVDVKIAQKLLGHSSLKMTMDIYTHIRESRLGDAAAQLNSFINS